MTAITETVGGCIRFYPWKSDGTGGPEWHINDGHATVGFRTTQAGAVDPLTGLPTEVPCQPVIEPDGDLTVEILGPTAPVVALIAKEDETLTTRGITAGGSGGVGHVTIRFFHHGLGRQLNLADPADYKLIRGEYSNLWIAVTRLTVPAPA